MDKKTIEDETTKLLGKLDGLRDEARVRLHLAALDMKSEFSKLEPELDKLRDGARDLTESSRNALLEGVRKLEKLLAHAPDKDDRAHGARH